MQIFISRLGMLRRFGQNWGPYLMLEILMPGGSLLALLLFMYRRRKLKTGSDAAWTVAGSPRAPARIVEQLNFLLHRISGKGLSSTGTA